MIAESNRLPRSTLKPAFARSGLLYGRMTLGVGRPWRLATFSATVLPLMVSASPLQPAGREQFVHHRRQPAGAIIFFAEIFARRLHVDEERHVVADRLPVLDRELDADMARDRDEVNGRVGRAADRRAGDDRVLECGAGENVGGLEILAHDLDRAPAGFVGDLPALAIGRRNRGAAGQRHAERLGHGVHGRGGAHGVAMADRRRRGGDDVDELLVVDLAGGEVLARLPDDHAGAGSAAPSR